jgi:hypothetical protein
MSSGKDESSVKDSSGIDFLDFLFTVAISVGLTPEVLGVGAEGLLSLLKGQQGWPSADQRFYICSFLLGLINLALSWFGYHASIRNKPLTYTSVQGMIRFILDIFLVIIYGIMLINYQNLNLLIASLFTIHVIFAIWDLIKISEHKKKYEEEKDKNHLERYRREYVTFFALFVVTIISWGHFFLRWNRWAILILALAITIFYRVNKLHRVWERLLLKKILDEEGGKKKKVDEVDEVDEKKKVQKEKTDDKINKWVWRWGAK